MSGHFVNTKGDKGIRKCNFLKNEYFGGGIHTQVNTLIHFSVQIEVAALNRKLNKTM
jgi:hypothetical protein